MAHSEGNPQSEWDGHAQWWQREFTDGVDPEYTEQIIPIVMKYLAGRERVLDNSRLTWLPDEVAEHFYDHVHRA